VAEQHGISSELTTKGSPLPTDFQAFNPENFYARGMAPFDSNSLPSVPSSFNPSRRASSPNGGMLGVNDRSVPPPVPHRGPSPLHMGGGPGYANLPSHGDDMRRLVDECTAAKESARVLAEALVFTSPEELDKKPIIKVRLAVRSRTRPELTLRSSTASASWPLRACRGRWVGRRPKRANRASERYSKRRRTDSKMHLRVTRSRRMR